MYKVLTFAMASNLSVAVQHGQWARLIGIAEKEKGKRRVMRSDGGADAAMAATMAEVDIDFALIGATLDGDDESYARLIHRHQSAIARVLRHFSQDRLIVEELVQDTFVEAYFSLRRFRNESPFFPWLRTIALRVGYRLWRRQRRDRDHATQLRNQPQREWSAPSDTADYVYGLLAKLGPEDRLVLTFQYIEGWSVKDIAESMNWSLSLTKVRAFRARARLKVLLEKEERSNHEQH